jgi:hypothetical protein
MTGIVLGINDEVSLEVLLWEYKIFEIEAKNDKKSIISFNIISLD